jgi:hypothetical protein
MMMTTTATRQSTTAAHDLRWTDRNLAACFPFCKADPAHQIDGAKVDPDSLPGRGRWGLD